MRVEIKLGVAVRQKYAQFQLRIVVRKQTEDIKLEAVTKTFMV